MRAHVGSGLVTAALVALMGASPVSQAHAAELLGPEALKTELGGHTIKGYYTGDKVSFVEVYLPDGRITYKDDMKADLGRWSVEDNAFCTFYDKIIGGCWYVLKHSVNCYEFFLKYTRRAGPITAEVLASEPAYAKAARDSDKVTCDVWHGT